MRRTGFLAPTIVALAFLTGAADPTPSTPSSVRTPAPIEEDWKRDGAPHPVRWRLGCRVLQLREWIRVDCPGEPVRIAVIAGARDDVRFGRGWVAFPLRRGERRVIQLWHGDQNPEEFHQGARLKGSPRLVSTYWLDGAAQPVVTIQ